MNKHLIWAVALFSITLIICGTLIYINNNSWTVRFEMDDNTKEAIDSIEWEYLGTTEPINKTAFCLEDNNGN